MSLSPTSPVLLSIHLLEAVKMKRPVPSQLDELAQLSPSHLAQALHTDSMKQVFWVNVYNSFVLLFLRENPELYDNRKAFFTEPRFRVAGQELSFDDVEHGFLRRSKIKLSLGYVTKPLVGDFEKMMRVNAVDWRMHMALNCGAGSCPPIEIYRPETLEAQLDRRARAFLSASTQYDAASNTVTVTALMQWFRADFGGPDGIKAILRRFDLIPPGANPTIKYDDYSWELALENFA